MKEGLPRTLLTEALSKPRGESQKCRCGDSGSSLQVRSGPINSGWVHSVLWESPVGGNAVGRRGQAGNTPPSPSAFRAEMAQQAKELATMPHLSLSSGIHVMDGES